jgi:hypothetical protein
MQAGSAGVERSQAVCPVPDRAITEMQSTKKRLSSRDLTAFNNQLAFAIRVLCSDDPQLFITTAIHFHG